MNGDKVGLGAALAIAALTGGSLWWTASTSEREYQVEAEYRATDYAQAARQEAEVACVLVEPPSLNRCVEERSESARPDQRDEYDLEAQRTMAVWTRAMGWAAIIGMSVGIFGLALIFVTFRETRRAASTSQRTYEAFIAAEDASLLVEVSNGSKLESADDGVKLPANYVFDLFITNMGRSTAFIYGWSIGDKFRRYDDTLEPGVTDSFDQEAIFAPVDGYFTLSVHYSSPLRGRRVLDVTAKLRARERSNGTTTYSGQIKKTTIRDSAETGDEGEEA